MVGHHHRLNGHEFEQATMVKDREAWRGVTELPSKELKLPNCEER